MCKATRLTSDFFVSGTRVTGSGNLPVTRIPGKERIRVMIDCGLNQEPDGGKYNESFIANPCEINLVLVTHVHIDHVGLLPKLVKEGYQGDIICSEDSARLMPLVLADAAHIQKNRSKRSGKPPLYDTENVSKCLQQIKAIEYGKWYNYGENCKYMIISNGHLIGACMIVISFTSPDGKKVNYLFTGDYSPKNIFMDVQRIPQEVLTMPLNIVCESTYGNVDSTDPEQKEKKFDVNVSENVKKGGSVIIPAFSLGRAQEVLYHLKCMQKDGRLSKSVPIFLDGRLAIDYTRMYTSGQLHIRPEMTKFLPTNLQYITTHDTREQLLSSGKQKIVVTTSGMGSYGPAQVWIPRYLWETKALIQFTGYCAEGTYGRKLKETTADEFVFVGRTGGILGMKKASVEFTSEFSGHAKADQLIKLLRKFKNIRSVIINHGEPETKKIFAERIYNELGIKRVGVASRDTGFRIGEFGIEKAIPVPSV